MRLIYDRFSDECTNMWIRVLWAIIWVFLISDDTNDSSCGIVTNSAGTRGIAYRSYDASTAGDAGMHDFANARIRDGLGYSGVH